MRSRRRFLLAGVVAALGVALWLAPAGLALRTAVVKQVFGGKLVRLEVIEKRPVLGSTDWRIDHGVITALSPTQLTLRESDGRVQPIPLSTTTRVIRSGRNSSLDRLRPHQSALVTWQANGAAQAVVVDPVPAWFRKGVVAQLFGPKLVRLETIERKPVAGSTDWHVDRGVITTVSPTQVTLREADGRIQAIPLAGTTEVFRHGRVLSPDLLAQRWRVVVTWPASGAAQSVDVELAPPPRHGRR
ncbi:MAG TPA: hypothetical protein VFN33_02480 [Gaiellaceae bacterium]|nr:hypothetical protein [Gaiellaceae bacterium]